VARRPPTAASGRRLTGAVRFARRSPAPHGRAPAAGARSRSPRP